MSGKDLPQPEQFNYDVTRDTIRHFAYCIPDSNALYLDEEYAATTRWRGIIAPPGYLYAHGSPAWLGKMPGIQDSNGNELTGSDNATEAWEFFQARAPRRYDSFPWQDRGLRAEEVAQTRRSGSGELRK